MEEQVEMSPRHKVNAGLGWMPLKGPYGNLVFNFVDETGQTISGKFQRVDPYRNVDVNFGYRCGKKLEVGDAQRHRAQRHRGTEST